MSTKTNYKSTLKACCLGYMTQAIVINLTPLFFIIFQKDYHVSFEMLGRIILINFLVQFIMDILTTKYVDRIGHRNAVVLAHFLAATGLILLGCLPNLLSDPYTGIMIAVICASMGCAIIEVLVSPFVESLPGNEKASSMSFLHSFYSWGQVLVVLITTFLLRFLGSEKWFFIPILWAALPLFNLFNFLRVPLVDPIPDTQRISIKELLVSPFFIFSLLLMTCAGASEITISQWSSLFAEKGLGVSKTLGDLLGPCLFAVFMGFGRTIYGIWGEKIHLKKALLACSALCIVCYLLASLSTVPIVALLGCAVCGFSVSLMWPGVFSMTARMYPNGGTAMFGTLAVFGDIGCSLGPWMTGLISGLAANSQSITDRLPEMSAEQIGLKIGIFSGVFFPALMFCVILALTKVKSKNAKK